MGRRAKSISQHTFAEQPLELFPPEPEDPLNAERTRFSADRRHRFTLFRSFRARDARRDPDHYVAFIGMNPSSATDVVADATVARCIDFAFRWGFGGFYMLNAFSLRATASRELKEFTPNLPENDEWLRRIVAGAARVVVAWGAPGHRDGRGAAVEALLRASCAPDLVFCFGRNQDGSPTHPLYQRRDAVLLPYFTG
ncbi:MAG: DUF1643 domain-containing protein [Verrucomicrobia bacterium]|nr:DUF1643 domain-containing protein [Verrucomicrobiota bacterium]